MLLLRRPPRLQVEVEVGLVDPVDQPSYRHPAVEDDVDQVGGGQVLQVFDAELEQSGLVPDAEPVEVAQGVVVLEAGDRGLERERRRLLEGLEADEREEADDEGDRHARSAGPPVHEGLVDDGDQHEGAHDADHRIDVGAGLEVGLEVAADQHLHGEEVGAGEGHAQQVSRRRLVREREERRVPEDGGPSDSKDDGRQHHREEGLRLQLLPLGGLHDRLAVVGLELVGVEVGLSRRRRGVRLPRPLPRRVVDRADRRLRKVPRTVHAEAVEVQHVLLEDRLRPHDDEAEEEPAGEEGQHEEGEQLQRQDLGVVAALHRQRGHGGDHQEQDCRPPTEAAARPMSASVPAPAVGVRRSVVLVEELFQGHRRFRHALLRADGQCLIRKSVSSAAVASSRASRRSRTTTRSRRPS